MTYPDVPWQAMRTADQVNINQNLCAQATCQESIYLTEPPVNIDLAEPQVGGSRRACATCGVRAESARECSGRGAAGKSRGGGAREDDAA